MANHRGPNRQRYRAAATVQPAKTDEVTEPVAPDTDLLSRLASTPVGQVFSRAGGSLLVLRAFLGVTFTYAGLQKLANPDFFSATAAGSFQQQLRGSILTSPLHHLLSPVLHVATPTAILISLGEIAVGLGTLFGLFGRIAGLGGMLLSLSFFLTVSFNDNPYYYGPDIVFLFAWTPFVLSGSGALSLDAVFAQRAQRARSAMETAQARGGPSARRRAAEMERRAFMQKMTAAGMVGAAAVVLGGAVAAVGRLVHTSHPAGPAGALGTGTTTTTPSTNPATTTAPPASSTTTSAPTSPTTPAPTTTTVSVPRGTRIGPASSVPVGGAAGFTDPAQGVAALVVQRSRGSFRAFTAVCPHAGCTVQFDKQNDLFLCPCHGSIFNASTGAVERGPAASGLTPIPIALASNGQLYVDG